jgi:surface protein
MFCFSVSVKSQTKEPVAYYNSSTKVLTFTMLTTTEYNNLNYSKWKGANLDSNDPGWLNYNDKIEKVVFSSSFADARPENCGKWFYLCKNLTSITGLNYLNTSNVTSMASMFDHCESLTSLDLSKFNTSKVQWMNSMFWGCKSLTKLDLRSFNTSNVQYMNNMFYNCKNLKKVDVSSFNTSNVKSMYQMFYGCSSLVKLNLTSFTPSSSASLEAMFEYCENLKTIICNRTWNNTSEINVFYGCKALVGAISYDSQKVSGAYANPDNGYFTKVKTYPLKICGIPVTNVNCDDLTVIDGVTVRSSDGYAYYDPDAKRLCLSGVVIAALNKSALYFDLMSGYRLNINVEKDNMDYGVTFFSSSNSQSTLPPVMELQNSVWLYGSGRLVVNGIPSPSIYIGNVDMGSYAVPGIMAHSNLTIEDLKMTVQGSTYGICGSTSGVSGSSLAMYGDNCNVSVSTNGGPCIYNFNKYPTTLQIQYPEGAVFADNAARLNGEIVTDYLVIAPPVVGTGIYIAGVEVTNVNCDDLTTINGVSVSDGGYLFYDWDYNTLEMKGVIIRSDGIALQNKRKDLKIKINGNKNNMLYASGEAALLVEEPTTVTTTGSGRLYAVGGSYLHEYTTKGVLLRSENGTLTVKNGELVGFGTYAISGDSYTYKDGGLMKVGYYGTLAVEGQSNVYGLGTLCDVGPFRTLSLGKYVFITEPSGATFTNNCVYFGTQLLKNKGVIISYFNPADVNQDGIVNISDVVAEINTMAGDNTYKATADVNGDGERNISDVVAIINVMAGGEILP